MQNLITQATDSFLSSFVIKIKEMMLEFLLSLIEMINTHLMNLFETPIIRDFVSMGTTIGRFLFAATLIILLIDIVEEAGSMKSDQFKTIEWPTIFFNMVSDGYRGIFLPAHGMGYVHAGNCGKNGVFEAVK